MIITLSGVDGSGKTTSALFLKQKLTEINRKVFYIHMIQWSLVYRLGQFIQKFEKDQITGKRKRSVGAKYRQLILFFTLVDVFRFYILKFLVGKLGDYEIICDRYFYDLGIQAIYTERMKEPFERFYWRIIPRPDAALLFDINPRKAMNREGEHSLLYYEKKRGLYLDRCELWGVHLVQEDSLENVQIVVVNILSSNIGYKFV